MSIMEPRAQAFLAELIEICTSNMKKWDQTVQTLGVNDETYTTWTTAFKTHLESTLEDMVVEVDVTKDDLIDRIEQLLQRYSALCKQLSIPMRSIGSDQKGLYQEEKILLDEVNKLQKQVDDRMKSIDELIIKESKLCECLGQEAERISTTPLPTAEQIENYIVKIRELEQERQERESKFENLQYELVEMMFEMNLKPSLDFEKKALKQDAGTFRVTDANMQQLYQFHHSVKEQKKQLCKDIDILREKITALWEILAEDLKYCNEFSEKHPGNTFETLAALQNEYKRCSDLKKANIETFVNKLRVEIANYWEMCCYCDEQREGFEYFHDDLYTEDLLTLHDMELGKLKNFYNENSEIYKLLATRQELWENLLQLEERANEKNRFKNRGGQLLKEEKERNVLSKKIPKIEDKLRLLATTFEERNDIPFQVWGKSIDVYIKESYNQRDQEKKTKLSAKKQQRELTVITPGKSCLSIAGSTTNLLLSAKASSSTTKNFATPVVRVGSAVKRKIFNTPLDASKRTKLTHHANGLRSAPPKVQLNGKTICKQPKIRFSAERKKRVERMRRLSKLLQNKKKAETSDYENFEKEVSHRGETARSTLFMDKSPLAAPLLETPRKVLQPSNTPRITTPKHVPTPSSKLRPTNLKLVI